MRGSVTGHSSAWYRAPRGIAVARIARLVVFTAMLLPAGVLGQTSEDISRMSGDEFHSSDAMGTGGCCPTQECQNARLRELMEQRIDYARQCVASRTTPCHVQPELIRPPLCPVPKPPPDLGGAPPGGDNFGSNSKPTGKPPLLKGTVVHNDCVPPPDQQAQAELRKTGIEALDTLAAMGQQTDRVLNAMGRAIVEQLAYLAQPNAVVWNQRVETTRAAAQAAINYLTNDNAANHEMLRGEAEKAIASVMRDPTDYVGRTAAGILTGKATFVSGQFCRATVDRVQKAVADRVKATKAAKELKSIVQAEDKAKEIFGDGCGNQSTPLPPNRLNPRGLGNSCTRATWADELNDEIGAPVFDETHFHWDGDDAVTPWDQTTRYQSEQWGDRRFAGHSPERARWQAEGIPTVMPNGDGLQDIVDDMKAAGDGARGFVIIRRVDGSRHMFRTKNDGGTVKFRDSQTMSPGGYNFEEVYNGGPIQSSSLYRTAGPDQLAGPPAPRAPRPSP